MPTLADELAERGVLKTPRIIEAFRALPREWFLPANLTATAWVDAPLSIGCGQTNSQPLTVAFMLELLNPRLGDAVLDVGAGSGWTAALLGTIVGPTGRVIAIERIPELRDFAEANVQRVKLANVSVVSGDGSQGYPGRAPFDRIHVAAAAEQGVPSPLRDQLKVGGILVIPVGRGAQDLVRITRRSQADFWEERTPGFQFVPLIVDSPPRL